MRGHRTFAESSCYCFEFGRKVPLKKVEDSLLLAVVVVESLHGRSALRLGTSFQLDKEDRSCVVDGSTEVGRHIACILTGLLSLEFGEEAFAVIRGAQFGTDPNTAEKMNDAR